MFDAKRIEEMKRLLAKATEGVYGKWDTDELFVIEGDGMILGECVAKCETEADAQFIAESRQFVPDIIAAYEEQAEEIVRLRKALHRIAYEKTMSHYLSEGAMARDLTNIAREALK